MLYVCVMCVCANTKIFYPEKTGFENLVPTFSWGRNIEVPPAKVWVLGVGSLSEEK